MSVRLRIVNRGEVAGPKTSVHLISTDAAGEEVTQDITRELCVTKIAVDLSVGDVARVNMECLAVGADVDAVLDELVVRHVGRSRVALLAWRLRKWWWRKRLGLFDVTAFGSRSREYVGEPVAPAPPLKSGTGR